jgi:hypothetical protein
MTTQVCPEPRLNATTVVGVTVRRERRWTPAGATPARELVRSTQTLKTPDDGRTDGANL